MVTTHNLGFPRIGARRELKFALESYWKGQTQRAELIEAGKRLRERRFCGACHHSMHQITVHGGRLPVTSWPHIGLPGGSIASAC